MGHLRLLCVYEMAIKSSLMQNSQVEWASSVPPRCYIKDCTIGSKHEGMVAVFFGQLSLSLSPSQTLTADVP